MKKLCIKKNRLLPLSTVSLAVLALLVSTPLTDATPTLPATHVEHPPSAQKLKLLQQPAKAKKTKKAHQKKHSASSEKNQPLFRLKPGPPPGFSAAALDQQQTTFVSVYYQGKFLGNAMATFNDQHIQFLQPNKFLAHIGNLKEKAKVSAVLHSQLPVNSNKLCTGRGAQAFCKILQPNIAGVIFSQDQFRANLFVNPGYVNLSQSSATSLPDSTASFSFMNRNNILAAVSNDSSTYTLNNTSLIGYQNNQATVDMNVTRTQVTGEQEKTQFNFQQLTAGRYNNGRLYQVGMLTPDSGNFLAGQPILGVSLKNYGILPQQNNTGTPLIVYLPLSAQVSVYRGTHLIGVQNLPAGKQEIDTRNFPNGAYNVTLKITNQYGQTTTENHFFVKQGNVPGRGKTNYQISLGVLQKQVAEFTTNTRGLSFPSFTNKLIFSYTGVRKIANAWALQATVLSDFDQVFASSTLQYYATHFTISPGLMVSNRDAFGALVNGSFNWDRFSANGNFLKIFDQRSDQTINDINNDISAFKPLSTTNLQANGSLAYSWKKTMLSASASWSEATNADNIVQWGANLTQQLYNSGTTAVQFTVNLTRSDNDTTLLAGFTVNFYTSVIAGNATVNYQHDSNTDHFTSSSDKQSNIIGNAGLNKSFTWGHDQTLSLSGNYGHQVDSQSYNADVAYQSSLLQSQFNISHNINKGTENTTNFSANIMSTVVFAHDHFNLGNSHSLLSAVLVNIKAPEDVPVKVRVSQGAPIDMVANHSRLVFLQPYQTYQMSIQPNSATLYQYRKAPKMVTLYKGNVQYLTWTLRKQFILFTQLVTPKNKPLANALLMQSHEFDTTDEHGYIQAGLVHGMTKLTLRTVGGAECVVHLPKTLKISQGIAVVRKPLVCQPVDKSKK